MGKPKTIIVPLELQIDHLARIKRAAKRIKEDPHNLIRKALGCGMDEAIAQLGRTNKNQRPPWLESLA